MLPELKNENFVACHGKVASSFFRQNEDAEKLMRFFYLKSNFWIHSTVEALAEAEPGTLSPPSLSLSLSLCHNLLTSFSLSYSLALTSHSPITKMESGRALSCPCPGKNYWNAKLNLRNRPLLAGNQVSCSKPEGLNGTQWDEKACDVRSYVSIWALVRLIIYLVFLIYFKFVSLSQKNDLLKRRQAL